MANDFMKKYPKSRIQNCCILPSRNGKINESVHIGYLKCMLK